MTADTFDTVTANVLADGIVVRLAGSLDVASLADLRATFLRRRPEGCDDVTEIHERALAVLVAGAEWVRQTGGRLRFAAMSSALVDTADYFDVTDLLPRLPGPGGRAGGAARLQAR
jgi:anti-anti-sigma regulatory factor